ncbi:hypothetical protein [Streptomyces sp. NPDC048636]|uniref:hypothetical protein n=1 Tax=Streptomyces sp. NPDC048636 TaxID=3155762 RepID=UPI003422C91C
MQPISSWAGPVVLVWDDCTHDVDAAMRELSATRQWLTTFRFPPARPTATPADGVWAHLKNSLGSLAPCSIDELAAPARTRLRRMQYQPRLLDSFITETGLSQFRHGVSPPGNLSIPGVPPWAAVPFSSFGVR